MKKLLAAALLSFSALPASAAVLLGSATFATTDDLTQVQDGGFTYQFLDLTTTQGQSQAAALTAFGTSGFAVATSLEVAILYNAFGFTYTAPNPFAPITDSTSAEAANFVSHLGFTYSDADGDAAIGTYIDATYGQSYSCVGFVVCATNGFNYNDDVSAGDSLLGVYLVRRNADVPEPAMLSLFGLGAVALGVSRRRKHARR